MKEKDILCQYGDYWVMKHNGIFYVMKEGITHSESIEAFADYSLAETYAKHKGKENNHE